MGSGSRLGPCRARRATAVRPPVRRGRPPLCPGLSTWCSDPPGRPTPGSGAKQRRSCGAADVVGRQGCVHNPANMPLSEPWGIESALSNGSLVAHPSSPLIPLPVPRAWDAFRQPTLADTIIARWPRGRCPAFEPQHAAPHCRAGGVHRTPIRARASATGEQVKL